MMQLTIPYVKFAGSDLNIESVSAGLDHLEKQPISNVPWNNYPYKPEVQFVIAYCDDAVLLKYWVDEKTIKAVYRSSNEPVYKDSCVEFFIALNQDPDYYNFEFNCVGTCLAAYGPDRYSREYLPVSLIGDIKVNSLIKPSQDGVVHWELSLIIPKRTFNRHSMSSLDGTTCRMNFYKCGDDLPEPHFLAWNNIFSENPDFHLSEYFGTGNFAPVPELKETLNF